MILGRLAPSPTGYLHLGNAFSFLLNWLYVRQNNGKIYLRIDDIDRQRSKPEFTQAIMVDIAWLGLDWDNPGQEIIFQSQRSAAYSAAIDILKRKDLVYPCFCTRKELRSLASAPQIGYMGAPYPGTCRNLTPAQIEAKSRAGHPACSRLRCPDLRIVFEDEIMGKHSAFPHDFGGDFALIRSDNVYAYQLASVVDDADYNINFILRGNDLLPSTPRQILLFMLLEKTVPAFAHIPLILDSEGERLAKRHKSSSLRHLRNAGISPDKVSGYLAYLAGIIPEPKACDPRALLGCLSLSELNKNNIKLPKDTLAAIDAC